MIVDEVKEVVNLSEDEIEKSTNKGKFINGIGKHGDDLISLLEINSVVDDKRISTQNICVIDVCAG